MSQEIRLHKIYSQFDASMSSGLQIWGDTDWAQAPPAEVIYV